MRNPQELIDLLKAKVNPIEVGMKFSNYCNSYSVNIEGFLTLLENSDEDLKQLWDEVCLLWVSKCHKYSLRDYYDGRNERAVKTADTLNDIFFDKIKEVTEKYNYDGWHLEEYDFREEEDAHENPTPFVVIFVEKMGRDHRTLQQTFSKMVYWYLERNYEQMLSGKIQNAFWELPCV